MEIKSLTGALLAGLVLCSGAEAIEIHQAAPIKQHQAAPIQPRQAVPIQPRQAAPVNANRPQAQRPAVAQNRGQGLNQAQIDAMERQRQLMWNSTGGNMVYR